MTLNEAVGFYHSLEKFGIMPGLERIEKLCEKLGFPQRKLKFVHIAGTNGKGSTSTALAGVLTEAGYKTGLYTSPYVIDFRERIQLNMKMISPDELISVTKKVKAAIESLIPEGVKITEFEAVTAAAFTYYAEKNCDYVVLETGLGGRFDATNIIEFPEVSVITSVSLDHINILGDTLSEIAFEKCGIIKEGCPVVTSFRQPQEVLSVINEQADIKNTELHIADDRKLFSVASETVFGTEVCFSGGDLLISLGGRHQLENMSLVIEAVRLLRSGGAKISTEAVRKGIAGVKIPARTEIISEKPLVILDGSHNDGSTKALADFINKHLSDKRLLGVMGMMADKDCKKALGNLMPCFSEIIAVKPSNPRSMDCVELSAIAEGFGVKSSYEELPVEGIKKAFEKIKNFDALIVCGSLYLAGDVREKLMELSGK